MLSGRGAAGAGGRALRVALLPVILVACGCLQFQTGQAVNGVDQPAYGVPGGELPVTIYANMPGAATNEQGYLYVRMRNGWGVKNDAWDFISESRLVSGQITYAAARAAAADDPAPAYWGSDANHYWWGGNSGGITIEAAEYITITGTITVAANQAPGNFVIDYGLGDTLEDPTPPADDGESFNHPIAIGDLKIALGEKTPADRTAAGNEQNVEIVQLEIEAGQRAASYTVTGLSFTHTGTAGAMANVSSARLYRDNNNDGELQAGGDTLLDTINSPGTPMSFAGFSSVIGGGSKGNFIVVYNFGGATVGDTYSLSITPGNVTVTGAPSIVGPLVSSNTTTISNSPSLSVALGDDNPPDTYQVVGAGAQDRTLLQLAFTAGAVGDVELTDLTITCTYVGTAANEFEAGDVSGIRLYRDSDGDGVLDAATDPQLGSTVTWTPGGLDTTIAFSPVDNDDRVVSAGSTVNFIVVIDLSGSGADEENMMVRLAQAGHATAEDSGANPVPCTGTFPIGGTRTNVLNDLVINFDPDGVTFSAGPNDPGPSDHTPSDTGIVAMQTRVQAPSGQKATINDLVVWNNGTATGSTDISAVRFYRDFDGDGAVNGSDYEIASGTFNTYPPAAPDPNGCRIQVSGGYDIPASEQHTFLFILDLSGNGSADETVKLRLLDPSDYTDIPGDITVGDPPTEANLYTGPVLQEASTITLKTSTLNVVLGAKTPPAKGIVTDAQKEPVLQVKLTAGALANVTVTEIKFDASGTGDDAADITAVHLYNDVDSDGEYDSGTDPSIGSGSYSGNNGVVTFSGLSEVINAGQTENWLLVYDLAGSASGGETFQSQVASENSITCAGSVSVSGPPVVSNVLTVHDTGTLTFTAGAGNPADSDISQGETDVVALHLVATANDIEDIEVTQVVLTHSGTALDADIVSIELYRDVDSSGTLSGPDVQLGSTLSSFGGGTLTFNGASFPVTVSAGDNVKFILVFDMAGGATLGRTLIEKLSDNADMTATGVTSGQPAGKIGAPISGGTLTVSAESTLTLAAGANNPGDGYVQRGEQDVVMVQVKLTAGAAGAVDVTSVRFKASGTGNDNTHVSNPILLARDNGDGGYDPGDDPTIDTVAPPADNGYFTFNFAAERINASESVNWIVVYDYVNDPASENKTFKVTLVANADVTATDVGSGNPITPAGAPVGGGEKTVTTTTAITWNGSVSSNFNLAGNYDESVGPGPGIDVTVPNVATKPVVSVDGDAKSLAVQTGSSVKVEGGKSLNCYGNVTLDGTLELEANSTLRMGGSTVLTANPGSNFKALGTSQQAGGYAKIESASGTYTMVLSGDVNVRNVFFYDLGPAGVELAANSTDTVFDNVVFFGGVGGRYLDITGAAWDGHNFSGGMGFQDSGGTNSIRINVLGMDAVVTVNPAASSGSGWLGDGSEDEAPGDQVLWSPTAVEGLEAGVRRSPGGNLLTWSAAVERGTAGYRVLRRRAERHGEHLEEERGGAEPAGGRFERLAGVWRKVHETPAGLLGGEPRERRYRWLDRGAPAGCEYLIEELEVNGDRGTSARALQRKVEQ